MSSTATPSSSTDIHPGSKVVDEKNPRSDALCLEISGHADSVTIERGPRTATVAEENPEYSETAQVAEVVFEEDLDAGIPDWEDLPLRTLRSRMSLEDSPSVYSYPLPRLQPATATETTLPTLYVGIFKREEDSKTGTGWGVVATDGFGISVNEWRSTSTHGVSPTEGRRTCGLRDALIRTLEDAASRFESPISIQVAKGTHANELGWLAADDPGSAIEQNPHVNQSDYRRLLDNRLEIGSDVEIQTVGVTPVENKHMWLAKRNAVRSMEERFNLAAKRKREQKAREALPNDWAVKQERDGVYTVKSYTVDLNKGKCECPDCQQRFWTCKHQAYLHLRNR